MPVIHRERGLKFSFFSSDKEEPPHVHVTRAGAVAKWWLDPLRLQYEYRFSPSESRIIRHILEEKQQEFLEQWHEYFGL